MDKKYTASKDYIKHFKKFGSMALIAAASTHFFFIGAFYYLDAYVLAFINIFSVSAYLYGLRLLPKALIKQDYRDIGWLVYCELIIHGVVASYYLGLASGFQYYVFLITAFPFFNFKQKFNVKVGKIVTLIIICLSINFWLSMVKPVITVNSDALLAFETLNLAVFLTLASFISYYYAKANSSYRRKIFQLANIDFLTGLYTRRFLIQSAEPIIGQYARDTKSNALLVLDIDKFKDLNDSLGHQLGDKVLVNLALILQECVRHTAVVSRWGGDEFVLLLPDTDNKGMTLIARRILEKVRHCHTINGNQKVYFNVTIGGAIAHKNESFENLLERADAALYEGKALGRDQFVLSKDLFIFPLKKQI